MGTRITRPPLGFTSCSLRAGSSPQRSRLAVGRPRDRLDKAMIVECRAVTKRFGPRLAVDRLDLDVPAGLCFGLLGPNGAGKTTTLKMIYGVAVPTSGSVRVFGLDVAMNTRSVRARLGVSLQESSFIEVLSPVENLRIFGRYHLLAKAEIEAIVGRTI